jgi:hypothetical protein
MSTKEVTVENPSPAITDAGAPFDNPDADVILRSYDNVDFRVFKLLMSLASPFFRDIFALPQALEGNNSDKTKDGLPVVQMTEEKKILETLLLMCYPMAAVDPPDLETLSDMHLLLEAATKYNVERVEKRVLEWLVAPRFLDTDPMRVFAIACCYRSKAKAKLAAEAVFSRPLLESPYVVELELITGGQLYQLLKYHRSCIEATKKLCTDFTWIKQTSFCWFNCTRCNRKSPRVGPSGGSIWVDDWWYDYMQGVAEALRSQTWDEKKTNSLMETALQGVHVICEGGTWRAKAEMQEFREILGAKIKEVVSKVPLDLQC